MTHEFELFFVSGSLRYLSGINRWNEELSSEIKIEIENHWGEKITHQYFKENADKQKFYILSMFPYPSGSLHMGHIRVYSISDSLARFFRMKGLNVIHPMGWDAFGLPAENAALDRGVDPDEWTQKNIASMKSIMERMNFSFDWDREFATCDSDYYKWTQFLFLKLYENNLAYRKEEVVNWDPIDQTVLANEQVDAEGRSWRSGAVVEKKKLKQWFIRATVFSKSLLDGLSDPLLKDWKDVVDIQRHWIGKVNGTTINFQIVNGDFEREVPIWIKRPEYIDSAQFVGVKAESLWTFGCNVEGMLLPYKLKNPFTSELLPVYVTDSFDYPDGTDICLGIPVLSEAHKRFADSVNISESPCLQQSASNEELLSLREKICSEARERGIGGYPTSSNLKDWLISRQRYWGTPIPIIHCQKCGEQPVPESDLPVRLPKVKSIKIGKNPLKETKDWLNVTCPKCGGEATRETDTMDTFVDSSWYYLRYLDPDNENAAFNVNKSMEMMPVDVYIGGKEHAVLHLYFARFMNHFLHSMNLVPHREPFKRLLCQGMVRGRTFRSKTGEYMKHDMVEKKDDKYFHKTTGEPLILEWEKMSKSKYNGVEPKDMLDTYGIDTTRLVVLGDATPHSDLDWDVKSFQGILNWQHRLWLTVAEFIRVRSEGRTKPPETEEYKKLDYFMFDSRNFYVGKVTDLLERTFNVATAVKKMQGLTGALRKADKDLVAFSQQYERALAVQIIMLVPVAPHFASELWAGFLKAPNRLSDDIQWDVPVCQQEWPKVDDSHTQRSEKVMGMLKLNKYKTKHERKMEKLQKKLAARQAGTQSSVENESNGDGNVVT